MLIEAELTVIMRDVDAALGQRAPAYECTYARVLLTYKEPAVDDHSGSKFEHETTVENADVLVTVLTALGVAEFIAFRKHCVNYTDAVAIQRCR